MAGKLKHALKAMKNGKGGNAESLLIGEPLSLGYRPTLPLWVFGMSDVIPQFYLLRDIELMMIHPIVVNVLNFFKGGIFGAEFWGGPSPDGNDKGLPICPSNPEVDNFVMRQCQRFWERGVWKLQGGYEYGWIACESMYFEEQGKLVWNDYIQFSPRDVWLLTQGGKEIGVRVRQIRAAPGAPPATPQQSGAVLCDLWMASEDIPAKGVWYTHNPRYSQYYGQSQLLGAWRPWRRLAWKDAAENNLDGGIYRYLMPGIIARYPEEDLQAQLGSIATTQDSQGFPRKYARDFARQLVEWYKSGAAVGLPSTNYPIEMGGGQKWALESLDMNLKVADALTYINYLSDQISYGIGVPPELIHAGDSGSGFSGRAIPLESFIMMQQRLADCMLHLFVDQTLKQLVKQNFGDVPWEVKVKPLLVTKRKMQQGDQTPTQGAPGAEGGGNSPNRPDLLPTPHMQNQRGQGSAPQSPYAGDTGPFSMERIMSIANKIRGAA